MWLYIRRDRLERKETDGPRDAGIIAFETDIASFMRRMNCVINELRKFVSPDVRLHRKAIVALDPEVVGEGSQRRQSVGFGSVRLDSLNNGRRLTRAQQYRLATVTAQNLQASEHLSNFPVLTFSHFHGTFKHPETEMVFEGISKSHMYRRSISSFPRPFRNPTDQTLFPFALLFTRTRYVSLPSRTLINQRRPRRKDKRQTNETVEQNCQDSPKVCKLPIVEQEEESRRRTTRRNKGEKKTGKGQRTLVLCGCSPGLTDRVHPSRGPIFGIASVQRVLYRYWSSINQACEAMRSRVSHKLENSENLLTMAHSANGISSGPTLAHYLEVFPQRRPGLRRYNQILGDPLRALDPWTWIIGPRMPRMPSSHLLCFNIFLREDDNGGGIDRDRIFKGVNTGFKLWNASEKTYRPRSHSTSDSPLSSEQVARPAIEIDNELSSSGEQLRTYTFQNASIAPFKLFQPLDCFEVDLGFLKVPFISSN
ncbi:unnamed protein product [Nesidiocoris tenuis]|uniref:Uncharacterized protein n=1 Tax=Nesidiocoris tenuis TaxID=355587 RepID=A0A6H5G4S2_9HEMI|nr:unnamed protein product [Nesidiocoris tenuis]